MITAAAFLALWLANAGVLLAWHLDNKRHAAQTQAILDRISTEPRIELRPAPVQPVAAPDTRKYIADHSTDDEAWNDFRGVPDDEL